MRAAPGDATDTSMDGMPRRFGKYTLIRKLATGGMAELFLALQKSVAGFEKLVVIKCILPAMNDDKAFVDMLLHEARVAATLNHPNIVQVFDVGAVDGTYFIAMEHVHGEDLRSIVRQMRKRDVVEFPIEHALSIVLGMCAGLAHAHDKRDLDGTPLHIVHRDVSPQNVVVTFTGDVKVVDFGIAKSRGRVDDTRGGHLKGKVPYMSPEQARGDDVDWRSDVFATGVMLFELTTGKRLFKAPTEYETLKLICDREYPLPSQARPGYPHELEVIVMKALAKDRERRWQSAREMQAALEEFIRRERLAVSTIALSQFMQKLFEDKLASQKEALLQGKHLADIIAVEGDSDSSVSVDSQAPSGLTTGAAARTLGGARSGASRGAWVAAVAGLLLLGAAGTMWLSRAGRVQREPDAPVQSLIAAAARQPAAATTDAVPAALPPPAPSATPSAPEPSPSASAEEKKTASRQAARPPEEANRGSAAPATVVGTGKLYVTARGGWCNLSVDGVARGPTPVAALVLPAGTHTIACTPEGGKAIASSVRIEPDGVVRYAFTIPAP